MKPRALIVDDSLTVRMDLSEAFENAGFSVTPCSTLQEARAALAGNSICARRAGCFAARRGWGGVSAGAEGRPARRPPFR